jgi:phenylalanyl-tRNA synthetase alpha chain
MQNVDIEKIKNEITSAVDTAADAQDLEALKVKYLGRKGLLAELTAGIPALPPDQRAAFGKQANELKQFIVSLFDNKQGALKTSAVDKKGSSVDLSLPGISQEPGRLHPITQVMDQICGIFTSMGFSVVEGPEMETEFNNFTGLNIPLDHPSRDAFDTFYLTDKAIDPKEGKLLLRSHTSPVQIRAMKCRKPPLAIVVPGRVYRPDATDASHSCMFHQVEGFMVDTDITLSHLKGVLETFARSIFGDDIKMRFRPHFFPFTEPSAEVDISCIMCKGKGCSVCGKKGWLEILGSGMIHPNVFKHVGYDPKKYTGFAFGMGVERIAMLKYGIDDIRLFFQNDLRFLKQF